MPDFIYSDESYKIIGSCFNVYNEKGCGFLEPVYQECMEIDLEFQQIPFRPQAELELIYRNRLLKNRYIPDLICYDKIIVEIKAVKEITDKYRAQVMNYLKATGYKLGLLVNFGHHPQLEYERIVNTKGRIN